ncbi:MAG: YhgE/Pip domain-containing protein [Methanobacterium sp.]
MLKGINEIFRNDIKSIIRNPVVIIALIIIICLPSLYSLVNISAVWNPYNETGNMKVAIVDNDLGYTAGGVDYNFGKNLSDELAANNTDFNWQFVDENTARYGVNTGAYYAAFIIPSNFTENLLSFETVNPRQAQISYIVNDKLNPIAPRLTNVTADTLLSNINSAVDQAKINLTSGGNLNGISFTNGQSNNPVYLNSTVIDPVYNYGSAIAPFYISLSLFIGCIVAIAMLSTRVRSNKKYHHVSVYLGRMGLFLIISVFQALVIALGVLNLHIQVTSPYLFTLTALYIGLCFMVIAYSLTSIFGNMGKALVIILLVLQIMTTGGTFPVNLLPSTFQNLAPYLPMSYAIGALREVMAGVLWNSYWYNILVLAIFPTVIFVLTILIKERFSKPAEWTEEKLKKSGLF